MPDVITMILRKGMQEESKSSQKMIWPQTERNERQLFKGAKLLALRGGEEGTNQQASGNWKTYVNSFLARAPEVISSAFTLDLA